MPICIPLQAASMDGLLRLIARAAGEPAHAYELRLDALKERPDVAALLDACDRPAIVTCRAAREGGAFAGDENERLSWLRAACRERAAFVDVEAFDVPDFVRDRPHGDWPVAAPESLPGRGLHPVHGGRAPAGTRSRIIASRHFFDETPDDLDEIVEYLAMLPADVVKFAVMAKEPADNMRVFFALRVLGRLGRAAIGLAMGEWGEASRILGGRFGSIMTFGALEPGAESAPGQLTARELEGVHRVDRIGPDTRLFAVVGEPIAHSLSPAAHNAAFEHDGLDACYLRFRVHDLRSFISDVAEPLGLSGLSVTIPHKEAAYAFASVSEAEAQAMRAANTLTRIDGIHGIEALLDPDIRTRPASKKYAFEPTWAASNTDGEAALAALGEAFVHEEAGARADSSASSPSSPSPASAASAAHSMARAAGPDWRGRRVLVLGAGGTARALVYRLGEAGARVGVAARRPEAAEELARAFGAEPVDWDERLSAASEAEAVVNTTPVGMYPREEESPLEGARFHPDQVVMDAVYRPRATRLLKDARRAGATTVDGLSMFVRQAALQYEFWTERPAPLEIMAGATAARLAHRL